MLRAGIIGCGGITERRHAPILAGLQDRVEIAAISDVSEDRLALIGDQYEVSPAHRYGDYEAMLQAESLDLVHVCTPHHLHEPQAIAAMQAGTDVLLEKPIATTVEEADRIIAVAEETGRRLTVSHNQLFRPLHRAITDCISSGNIGDIFLIRSEGLSPRHVVGRGVDQHWRTSSTAGGGGPLIDNGYHQIYCAVDYLRSPAKRVFARVGRYVQDIDVEDTALLLIEHENGATTSVQVGWSAPAGGVRVEEVYGTKGQIRLGGDAPFSVWRQETGTWTPVDVESEGHDEVGFPALASAFIDAVASQGDVPVQAEAARHVLGIVRAAYESGTSGQPGCSVMSDFSILPDVVDLPRGAWAESHRLNIFWRGRSVVSLTQGAFRAYLHPVYTPAGHALTTESPPDHPHHNAIWLAADRVHCRLPFSVDSYEEAVYNFYVNETFQGRAPGRIVSVSIDHETISEVHLRLKQTLNWQGPSEWGAPDGRILMHETRTIDVHPDDQAHVIDLRSRLSVTEWDITIGPVRHAYFGIRMTEALRGTQGAVYTDADGRTGATAISGEASGWIDCSGRVTRDHAAGIAVFRPPEVAPYPWQVADYGTITINPFGTQACAVTQDDPAEQAIRIVVHDGDAVTAGIAERYDEFVTG